MKKFHLKHLVSAFLFPVLPALGFIACDRPENADFSVSPEPTELVFEAAYPTSYTFQIASGTDDWEIVSDAEWLIVKKENNNVTFAANPNVTFNDLSATVNFKTGKKTRMTVSATQKALQVYAAGNENNVATYWHNGRKVPMEIGQALNGIYVTQDGTVHLVGAYSTDMAVSIGFYYTAATGRIPTITHEKGQGNAFSVFVDESKDNVYYTSHEGLIDYEAGTSVYTASYWENHMQFPEEESMTASDILVDNNKLYVLFDIFYKADNRKVELENAGQGIYPNCMTVHNGDVYVAGYYLDVDKYCPAYWINGKIKTLPTAVNSQVYGISIAENGDIYLAGSEGNYGERAAAYWKNGEKTVLSDYNNGCAGDVFALDGHLIVTGFAPVNDISTAKIWIDGVETNISDGTADAWIEDTFIR